MRFRPPSSLLSGLLVLASVGSLACTEEPGGLAPPLHGDGAPVACPVVCPAERKCHYRDGTCVYGGIAACEACGEGALCSPLYPEPTCVDGTCEAPADFPDGSVKLIALSIAPESRGCDLDGDGDPDNRLAGVLEHVDLNAEFARAIEADRITMLLAPGDGTWGEAGAFDLSFWFGTLSPQSLRCSPVSPEALCTYTVSRSSYDPATLEPTCQTWLRFRDVTRTGSRVASPAPGRVLDMVVPVEGGGWLLQLLGATLDAELSTAQLQGPGLGPQVSGRLCAAVLKADLLLAIDSLPADVIDGFGGAAVVKEYLDDILASDLDANGNGKADSVSVALEWTAIPARIVGYSPQP